MHYFIFIQIRCITHYWINITSHWCILKYIFTIICCAKFKHNGIIIVKKNNPNTEMDSGGKTISVEEAALLLQEPTGEHFSLYH